MRDYAVEADERGALRIWCSMAVASFLFSMASPRLSAQEVTVYVSSKAGDRLALKPALRFGPSQQTNLPIFRVNDRERDQTIVGFGASFLEAGMICLRSLPMAQQEEVLRKLFDPERGAGFSAMKTVIGATDFMSAGPFYTYDETPGDVEMKHFSIARDLGPNGLITFIKRARTYGRFVLQAPMDYPPDWMLYDVKRRQDLDPEYFDALARYYLCYLRQYEEHGVFVDYLSLFNEPGVYTKINYAEILDLLKNHVGPLLQKEGTKTKIQLSEAPTRENAYHNYPTVLDDPAARQYIAALPYHGYDWKNPRSYEEIAELHKRYPDLPLWMTEVCHAYEVGDPKTMPIPRYDFEDGDFWGNVIMSDLNAGAAGWTYWNTILDEKGGPWMVSVVHEDPEPNIQHPVVIVNRATHKVTYTGLYYYLAHFSKFVRPGEVRIGITGSASGVRCVAFQKPKGGHVAELINSSNKDVRVQLNSGDRAVMVNLPALSITTLLW